MSKSPRSEGDLCAVCREAYIPVGSNYCSPHCRLTANQYRRRLDNTIHILRTLGFAIGFINGVQVLMTMPEHMRDKFPKSTHGFTFPDFWRPIDDLNAKDFRRELRRWLGDMLGEYITYASKHKGTKHVIEPQIYMHIASVTVELTGASFECPDCKRAYIKSVETFDDDFGICVECSNAKIPF